MEFRGYLERRHFANLDGLRFVCISMVLWHHATPGDLQEIQVLSRGFLGVDFFFVLSGFLITTLLLREARDYGQFSIRDFYIRRALRILPVYVFVVSAVSFYYVGIKGRSDLADLVPFYYLFLSNFLTDHIPTLSITWSLSVEEQYYVIWPLLMLLLTRRPLIWLALIVVAANVLGSMGIFGLTAQQIGPLTLKLPNATYAPIIMGALLALALDNPRGHALAARSLGGRWTALAGFALLALAIHLTPFEIRGWPNLLIHTLMTATLAALVLREDNAGLSLLRQPVIARVGAISYGIYLYHLIALDITNRALSLAGIANDWTLLAAYSLLSVLIAEVSFRTLEAWFRRFRPQPRLRHATAPSS